MFVGVTGHQDIPTSALPFIKNGITQVFVQIDSQFTGVSSLAKGADQLFSEIAVSLGGRLRVVLPCQNYESAFDDEVSAIRFRSLLKAADEVERLNHEVPSETAFFDAGKRVVDLSQSLIAIWDGLDAQGKGGTADIVKYAFELEKPVAVIWPPGLTR